MSFKQWLCLAAWACLPGVLFAQSTPARPDPGDPDAPVAPMRYESAFVNYRPLADEKPGSDEHTPDRLWFSANELVGKLGGHAAHLKDPPSGAATLPAQPAKPTDDAAHRSHH